MYRAYFCLEAFMATKFNKISFWQLRHVFQVNHSFEDRLRLHHMTQQPAFQNYIKPETGNNPILSRSTTNSGLGRAYDLRRLATESNLKPYDGNGVDLCKLLYLKYHTFLSAKKNVIEPIFCITLHLFQTFC